MFFQSQSSKADVSCFESIVGVICLLIHVHCVSSIEESYENNIAKIVNIWKGLDNFSYM